MKVRASTPEACQLLHDGSYALAELEAAGIRIDLPYLRSEIDRLETTIRDMEDDLRGDHVWRLWQKTYRDAAQLYNLDQLGKIIFGKLGYQNDETTTTGRYRANKHAFEKVDLPFVKKHIKVRELIKAKNTYLRGILREVDPDGFLHPFFHLNTVTTFRSSASDTNIQNLPVRNPEIAEIVRRCCIPRKGRFLVEVDYGQIEVRVAACRVKDPNLIRYCRRPDSDMHRDTALDLFLLNGVNLPDGWWGQKGPGGGKAVRQSSKNQFVFPQFYGDFYAKCARYLWEAMERDEMAIGSLPIRDHLRQCGIESLGACDPNLPPKVGTYEHHVKKIEDEFWGQRFPVYAQWKRDNYAEYHRKGYIKTLTGFVVASDSSRNEINNIDIQGSSFHCLLQSIIWINRYLRKHKMRSLIIAEVHDSILADVPENELADFIYLAKTAMTKWLPKKWPWIIVPLEVEAEVCPQGSSWYCKKAVKEILHPSKGQLCWDAAEKKWGYV